MLLPLRALHVHAGNMYGGVEAMLLTQARERYLCPTLQTSFALCFDGRFAAELTAAGATVHRLGNVRTRNPLSIRRARRNLQELLKRETFDVVVTHSCWSQAIFGPAVRAQSVPLAFYQHSPVSGRHWLERWARRTPPDLVLCNSNFTAATSSLLFSGVRAETVYCPVALPVAEVRGQRSEVGDQKSEVRPQRSEETIRAQLQTAADATVIVQVSRMEPWKGHAAHLEALSLLKDLPDWVCWQVGGAQSRNERDYLDQLKKLAADLGIAERVRFLGERADVTRLLSAADVFCQPNTAAEPFGVVFVEALGAQLPVVTTDLGGAREIVDSSCGMLVPPGDARALAETLRGLIQDSTLRERLGAAGPTRARELCDPVTQLERFHGALRGIVQSPRSKVQSPGQ
jgi:glycosyltransferase involved in cell wall biosynthesis